MPASPEISPVERRHWNAWFTVVCALALSVLLFDFLLTLQPEVVKVSYLPDDAFYYLTLARNYARFSTWTFDSGLSATTGFHPLFAYLLIPAYRLVGPSTNAFINAGILINLAFTAGALLLLLGWVRHLRSAYFALFVALILSARNFVYNSASVMEWAPAVCAYLGYFTFLCKRAGSRRPADAAILFLLGLLATLCRTDFGLQAFCAAASLGLYRQASGRGPGSGLAWFGVLGAGVGVGLMALLTHAYTGDYMQSSAYIKNHVTSVIPLQWTAGPVLVGYIVRKVGLVLIALAVLGTGLKWAAGPPLRLPAGEGIGSMPGLLALFGALGLLAYGFLALHTGVFPWYTGNFLVPFLALLAWLSLWMKAVWAGSRVPLALGAVVLVVVAGNLTRLYPLGPEQAHYPCERSFYDAGNFLAQAGYKGRTGAWNAGIVGFYEGGRVVNLDGLTNAGIAPYVVSDRVPDYVDEKGITHIVDQAGQITNPWFRKAAGYDDPAFLARFKVVKEFGSPDYPEKMVVWEIQPKALPVPRSR